MSSSESGLPGSDPSLFAVLDLNLAVEEQKGSVQVELLAHSEVTEASLVVLIQLEVPLQGLQVEPPPVHRVLMESVVVSVFFFCYQQLYQGWGLTWISVSELHCFSD